MNAPCFCLPIVLPLLTTGSLQVYNDTIYDLLDENAFGLAGRASLRLKEDASGRVFVANLLEVCAAK